MEQMNQAMLNMLQTIARPKPAAKPSAKDAQNESSSFKDMMEQIQKPSQADSAQSEKPVEDTTAPEQESVNQMDPAQQQERMVLAAMAMMQNPVVPVQMQDIQSETQTANVVDEIVAESAGTPVVAVAQQAAANDAPQMDLAQAQTQEQPQQVQEGPVANVETEPVQEVQTDQVELTDRGIPQEMKADDQDPEMKIEVADAAERTLFGEVKTVPVKVGETMNDVEQSQFEDVDKQMAEPLAKALAKGDSKVEIQLKPHDLGKVTVELTRHADGSMVVVLTAEKASTQTLLDKHAAGLQGLLYSQNQEQVRVEVYRPQEDQNSQSNYQQNDEQSGRQQEQRQQNKHSNEDFLQQLRLGLTTLDSEAL